MFSWALVQTTCHNFAMVYCKLCWPYQVEQFLAALRPLKWLGNAPESRFQMEVSLGVCFNKQGCGHAFLQTLYLQAESIHPREKIPWAPPLSNFMVHVAGILRSSSERRRGRRIIGPLNEGKLVTQPCLNRHPHSLPSVHTGWVSFPHYASNTSDDFWSIDSSLSQLLSLF